MQEFHKGYSGDCWHMIRIRLNALAVNLSRPSNRLDQDTVKGKSSHAIDLLSVRMFLLPPCRCEWVNVSSCTGSPR